MNPAPDQPDETMPTVLVIDDSVDVHRLLRARLRGEDLDLIGAENGKDGLEMARAEKPALVLLDLDMPVMDGFEVLRTLKDDPTTHHLPVIVLSGMTNPQDKVTAFDLGAVDYVTKPFDLTELRARIRSALQIHQLLRLLAQRAQIDGLTGLWNRAHFDTRWAEEVGGCARYERALTLALMDLDHFKSVNDMHGHPAGDAVLKGFAKILQRESRQADIACRYGGEEFALIMPNTSPEDAQVVCERIRAEIEKVVWPKHPERTVTASIGVAGSSGATPLTAEQWLETVDQSLYAAKEGGRNRVVVNDVGGLPTRMAKAG